MVKIDAVKTANRTLDIFEAFAAMKEPLSLTELARQIRSPISSCHGLIRTLKARGYVFLLEHRRRYYPTRRLVEVGAAISAHDPVVEKLVPMLESLRDRTEETIIVGKRQDDEILYLLVLEGPQTIRYSAHPGDRKPLHSSSLGKAFLGEMADEALVAFLRRRKLARVTPTTLTAAGSLVSDIRKSRKRGYFMTRGENVPDVMAVARTFPVDSELLGVCVAGPMQRMEAKAAAIGRLLTEATAGMSRLAATR